MIEMELLVWYIIREMASGPDRLVYRTVTPDRLVYILEAIFIDANSWNNSLAA